MRVTEEVTWWKCKRMYVYDTTANVSGRVYVNMGLYGGGGTGSVAEH